MAEADTMKQPEPFGKFLLLGQVAVGGMAEIYKARYADPALQGKTVRCGTKF